MPKRKSRKLRRSRKSKRKSLRKSRRRKRRRRKRSRRMAGGDCTWCTGASYGQNKYGPNCLKCRREKYEKLLEKIKVENGVIDLKKFFKDHMRTKAKGWDSYTHSNYTYPECKYVMMKESDDGKEIAENILKSIYDKIKKIMEQKLKNVQEIHDETLEPILEIEVDNAPLHKRFYFDMMDKLGIRRAEPI